MNNLNLGNTTITDKIRVSSAAIKSSFSHGNYLQYETQIFSEDDSQQSRQIIHGTSSTPCEFLERKTRTIHEYVCSNLLEDIK